MFGYYWYNRRCGDYIEKKESEAREKMSKEKKKGGKLKWIIIAVVVVIIIAAVAGGGDDSGSNTADTPDTTTGTAQDSGTDVAEDPDIPTEYRNALRSAESYSEIMHMSKQGIYDQLTSEYGDQFTAEAAQYAVDNLQADYNANALEKAEEYSDQCICPNKESMTSLPPNTESSLLQRKLSMLSIICRPTTTPMPWKKQNNIRTL